MNGQLRKEEDELRSIGVKTPTAQTDKLTYRQDNVRREETNQQPRTSTTAYNLEIPQQTQLFANKPLMFKSRYINDSGRWTQNAVNDGFVDIKDYIGDIKNDEQGISFNGKEMKISEDRLGGINPSSVVKKAYNKAVLPTVQFNSKYNTKEMRMGLWCTSNLGAEVATRAYIYYKDASSAAERKAKIWGLDSDWNTKADAYRHFIWNANMTRDTGVGYYQTRNIVNRYEYENMDEWNWLDPNSRNFDYLKDNTIIKGKMNQENLMDLWNNQVGRALANNKEFTHLNVDELFSFAQEHNLLINDANNVYSFLGITDYIKEGYLVDVEWNLTTGNVTVKNGKKSVTLKIGI